MEENTSVESAPVEQQEEIVPATVFSFGPEESSPVGAGEEAEAAGEEASQDSEQVEEPEGSDGNDARESEQKRINEVLYRERQRMQRKYERDDAYKLGRMMIDDLMRQDNTLSKKDAGKKAINNFYSAVSKRDGVAQSVLQDIQDLKDRRQAEPEEDEDPVEMIYQEVLAAPKPRGFDERKAYTDPAFIQLLTGCDQNGNQIDEPMPAKYAIQVYMANQRASQAEYDVAEKVRAGKALPKSIKPQQRVSPRTDWMKVSDEDFLKEKERRKNYY